MSLTNLAKSAVTLINATIATVISYLLKEDGGYLLLEDGGRIILDGSGDISNQSKSSATLTNISKIAA